MVDVNANYCPKNHACPVVKICPTDAIIQDSIYSAPRIDESKCVKCGKCTQTCFVFTCSDCKR